MTLEAGTGRDKTTDDDVLFETAQPVFLTFHRCFRQDSGGFLEGGRRDEALGVQGGFGDTEQNVGLGGAFETLLHHLLVFEVDDIAFHQLAGQEDGVFGFVNTHFTSHLANNHFDVFVGDVYTL